MFFSHPNPAKLAANNDLHGLFNCVVGKDQNAAKQAAALLAGLVDDFDDAPGTHEVLRDLEGDASPMAVYALACVVRHGFERSSHVKSVAALALYRLHAVGELQKIVEELRNGEHAGKTLHAQLSHDVLSAAVRAHDAATAQFILVNGQFASAGEVAPGLELLLSTGGDAAVAGVVADPAVFSPAVKGAGQNAAGGGAPAASEISA
ncbi:MAG TPA: hypothetical protein VGS57_16595 [Thermoanaerobaculia bacterium]|jgi:hypothetical protein|nr:hypothetical protein [Thermoanaerobaculia bacterium]